MQFQSTILTFLAVSLATSWSNTTVTAKPTVYFTTYCPSPTTFTYGTGTYTVTKPTTLTIEDCSCTDKVGSSAVKTHSSPLAAAKSSPVVLSSHPPSQAASSGTAGKTVTDERTSFTTYCPSPTTFTHNSKTYTVTAATTLTIEDCDCTKEHPTSAVETVSKSQTVPKIAWSSRPAGSPSSLTKASSKSVAAVTGSPSASEASASGTGKTVTKDITTFTTYCPSPTTFTHNSKTYTVTAPTTVSIEECDCTETPTESSAISIISSTQGPKIMSSVSSEVSSSSTSSPISTSTSATPSASTSLPVANGGTTKRITAVAVLATVILHLF